MSAADWFWVGRNNVIDHQRCGIRFEAGAVNVGAYWLGAACGWLRRLSGTPRQG